jgi:hypothetical protein
MKRMQNVPSARAATPTRSLEWTSASWPRYAPQLIIAARGQLSPAPQLQLQGLPRLRKLFNRYSSM